MAVVALTGWEVGTKAGWRTGPTGSRMFDDEIGSAASVVSTGQFSGGNCLRVNKTGSGAQLEWWPDTLGVGKRHIVVSGRIKVVSGSGADRTILSVESAGGTFTGVGVAYDFTSNELVVGWFSGTTARVALALNTWAHVDLYVNGSVNPHVLKWRVDEVDQADITKAASAQDMGNLFYGSIEATTCDVYYDDFVVADDAADYPLGPHVVVGLKPDQADTLTLSGTAANWSTFSLNGTLAAWDPAVALAAVGELPPVIGSTAAGLCQVTANAGDYAEIPMESYALAVGEAVAGARLLVCGWAASTSAATLGIHSYQGSVDRTIWATADPNFDASTSNPGWVCEMLTQADIETQAKLDALCVRVGYATDTTPAIGPHGVYVEVAIGPVLLVRVIRIEDGIFSVDKQLDPLTDGAVRFVATTPPGGRGATLALKIDGVDETHYVPPDSIYSQHVDAVDVSTVSDVTFTPDAGS